jgi:hypothetical protein
VVPPSAQPPDQGATQAPEVRPPADALAQAAQTPEAGPGETGSFNPQMFGDLIGVSALRTITVAQGVTRTVRVPITSAGAFKIADNESPRPQDRVFVTYNYYNNVNVDFVGPNSSSGGFDFPRVDLHREVVGFEKTFLGGDASVGMRLPFIELTGGTGIENSQVGDLSVILKLAWINDPQNGDVFSSGLVVTAPTGKDLVTVGGETIHSTLIQPWVGYIAHLSRDCYIHGFASLVVPTDDTDVTLLANDVGIGYWLIRGGGRGAVSGVIPTFEVHVNTPLNHRGADNVPVSVADCISLTGGVHFLSGRGWELSTAVGVPVTGPRPFDIEAIVQLNYRF